MPEFILLRPATILLRYRRVAVQAGMVPVRRKWTIFLSDFFLGIGAAVICLNPNGTLDNIFNGNGKSIYYSKNIFEKSVIALQKEGKVVQTGTQNINNSVNANYLGGANFFILRFNTNGSIDTSFGTKGKSVVDFRNYTDYLNVNNGACAIQANGKIITAGTQLTNVYPCVTRLHFSGKYLRFSFGRSVKFAQRHVYH